MSPIQTRGTRRESPFAINGDRPGHASLDDSDSPPRLGTSSIRAPTSPQTALSPTSESHRDNDDPTALRKSKAQSVCSASLNVTWTNQEVVPDKDLLLVVSPTRSASPVPTVKRVMIRREKTGTDWQSVFDVVKYGEEKRAAMVMREMGAETDDMMGPSP
ncbi:hypothetical protein CY34DRAFT_19791 [Suillus luteus UH-Slu-Lm8-n1]|uniref:Uncharacterized protein n=1 Tax=Suillus luteus UH-Slu-Lm8-n1 TaxID=930992 RepID=A0A0C9ZQJ6_9AGAM|nr:hypothetical protein CY34DRAFT_19791 [Suillus luteus UH-Slu-Lm8-n1]